MKHTEQPNEREVLELREYWVGGSRFYGLYRPSMYSLSEVMKGFTSIDEALQWAKDNDYEI